MKKRELQKDPVSLIFDGAKTAPSLPTEGQKEKMLDHILTNSRLYNRSPGKKIRQWIMEYPWRFAFGLSTIQAVVGTLIFGTGYTNLFLRFLGG